MRLLHHCGMSLTEVDICNGRGATVNEIMAQGKGRIACWVHTMLEPWLAGSSGRAASVNRQAHRQAHRQVHRQFDRCCLRPLPTCLVPLQASHAARCSRAASGWPRSWPRTSMAG